MHGQWENAIIINFLGVVFFASWGRYMLLEIYIIAFGNNKI